LVHLDDKFGLAPNSAATTRLIFRQTPRRPKLRSRVAGGVNI
jgi:hypothetical protein